MNLTWDDTPASAEKSAMLVPTIIEHQTITARIQELTERKKDIEKEIVQTYFPEADKEAGEWKRVIGNRIITVTRGERWTWDSAKLEEQFGIEPPDYIKRSYGCDKRKFEKLDIAIQSSMLDALTRNLGTLKITYEEVTE